MLLFIVNVIVKVNVFCHEIDYKYSTVKTILSSWATQKHVVGQIWPIRL